MSDDAVLTIEKESWPQGWQLKTIPQLVGKDGVFVDGDWVESKDQDPNGEVRLIQLADIGDGQYRNKSQRYLTLTKAKELGCTFLKEGDVLIARMPDPLGRACIFPGDAKDAVTVVDVAIARPGKDEFDTKWLMHFVNAPAFRKAVASMEAGSTRKRISRKNLGKILLPVPSLSHQRKIAAEIDTQFSRLDETVTALKRIQANLKRYKAAVLKAAVEGKLTEQWRCRGALHAPPCNDVATSGRTQCAPTETGADLLKRILAERRAKWEAEELAKMNAKGRVGAHCMRPDDSWKKKYKEPAGPDTANLPELPEGWVWSRSDQLFSFVTSGSRGWASYYSETGPVFLRMGNLDHDTILLDMTDIQRVQPPEGSEGLRTRVCEGDILVSITADVGMVGMVPEGFEEAYINQHIALARPLAAINCSFLAWYFASKAGQDQFKDLQRGATKVGLGLDDIKSVNVPIPPVNEQRAILEEIDRRLSVTEELEATIETNLKRAERLRQTILQRAFAGGVA